MQTRYIVYIRCLYVCLLASQSRHRTFNYVQERTFNYVQKFKKSVKLKNIYLYDAKHSMSKTGKGST